MNNQYRLEWVACSEPHKADGSGELPKNLTAAKKELMAMSPEYPNTTYHLYAVFEEKRLPIVRATFGSVSANWGLMEFTEWITRDE